MSSHARIASISTPSVACPSAPALSLYTQRQLLKTWLVITDVVVLTCGFILAYWLRFGLELTLAPEVTPIPSFYAVLAAVLTPILILVFGAFKLYDPHSLLGGVSEYSRIFNACSTGTMIVIMATFLIPGFVVSRSWMIAAWLLSFVLVGANRFITRRVIYHLRPRGYFLTPAAIIGTNEEATTLAADLSDWRSSGLRIVGFVSGARSSEDDVQSIDNRPVLGTTESIQRIIQRHGIEDLVVAITAVGREELLELCEEVNSVSAIQLRLSSGLYELLTTNLTVRTIGGVPLVSLNKVRLDPGEAWIKNVLEISLATLGLIALAPVLVGIAALVKLDSPGPILFRRRVLGVSGKRFDAFKFRTMHINSQHLVDDNPALQEELAANHKLKEDPRITRVGEWLRRYSLDELPQLLNVLFGQMGLVGPRMITAEEADRYGRHRLNLLTVKPGITGLWQVSGRSDLSYDERVRLDMYYIRNYSVWLDLQILFVQTLPVVIHGRGAY